MELTSLIVGIGSLVVSCLSFWTAFLARARMHEMAVLTIETLHKVRSGIDGLVKTLASKRATNQTEKTASLELLNNLERQMRRIAIFTNDPKLVTGSLFWFMENYIDEDRACIDRGLKYWCIHTRADRSIAKQVLLKIDRTVN